MQLDEQTVGSRVARSVKSRTQRPEGYPERGQVNAGKEHPSIPDDNYYPVEFVAQTVIDWDVTQKPDGWADPQDPRAALALRPSGKFHSHEGDIAVDAEGYPINPYTRTGIRGQGQLGKHGANLAEDNILFRINAILQLALVQRGKVVDKENPWALPGGMVDEGEEPGVAMRRELREETGADVDLTDAVVVYQGFVDDPRNTDTSWMETRAAYLFLTGDLAKQVQFTAPEDVTEVRDIQWVDVTASMLDRLYASHGELVRLALKHLYDHVDLATIHAAQLMSALNPTAPPVKTPLETILARNGMVMSERASEGDAWRALAWAMEPTTRPPFPARDQDAQFDKTKAAVFYPRPVERNVEIVVEPARYDTVLDVPEWGPGKTQLFHGTWAKIEQPLHPFRYYGSAYLEFVDMYERVAGFTNRWMKTAPVEAYQHFGSPTRIDTVLSDMTSEVDGGLMAHDSDWIVRQRNGEVQVTSNETFVRLYFVNQ